MNDINSLQDLRENLGVLETKLLELQKKKRKLESKLSKIENKKQKLQINLCYVDFALPDLEQDIRNTIVIEKDKNYFEKGKKYVSSKI